MVVYIQQSLYYFHEFDNLLTEGDIVFLKEELMRTLKGRFKYVDDPLFSAAAFLNYKFKKFKIY